MSPLVNSVLGLVFLGVGAAATFLMYHLWGYPYDKEKLHSSAPPGLVRVHRLLGVAYLALYVYFMVQMVPRLWTYQIEFPARTVVHLTLGMMIGIILIIKLAIVRWFRHMEARLIPGLGTALLICTALLIGLSAPFALRERYILRSREQLEPTNLERVRGLLTDAGFKNPKEVERLISPVGLQTGREVLTSKCIVCHDLRTVLARPQTADNWRGIVRRMAVRATFFDPISDDDQSHVTAYLVTISPNLQRSKVEQRAEERREDKTLVSVKQAVDLIAKVQATANRENARQLFQVKCSQCHETKQIAESPPKSKAAVHELVSRMVGEGLSSTTEELAMIMWYLESEYVH